MASRTIGIAIALRVEPGARVNVPDGCKYRIKQWNGQFARCYVKGPDGISEWVLKPAVHGVHELAVKMNLNDVLHWKINLNSNSMNIFWNSGSILTR